MNHSNESNANFYKCKKCGHEYYNTWSHCPNCRAAKSSNKVRPILWSILLLSIAALCIFNPLKYLNKENDLNIFVESNDNSSSIENELKSIDPPMTGLYQNYSEKDLIGTFEIRNHTDNLNYLLKFKDYNSKETIFTIFLNKNEDCKVNIPLGEYTISYACGDTWYGDDNLFGKSTSYMEYDTLVTIYREGNYIHNSYIDMTPVENGNLDSNYINQNDF